MMFTARPSTKGQIVIPKEIRKHLNLLEGDLLTIEIKGEALILQCDSTGSW